MAYLMLVDDDEDFASAAATVLCNAGHEVHVELDIESSRKSMKEKRPDLIILDVMFPENSNAGFEFAREIRHNQDSISDTPIIMLTAVNERFPLGFSSSDIDDAWMPVEDFIEKPVDLDILCSKVSKLLSR